MAGPESRLVARLIRELKRRYPQAWILKTAGNAYQGAGVPDIVACIEGSFVAIEVKAQRAGESEQAARRRVTELQALELNAIADAGGISLVALSEADLDAINLEDY